MSMLPIDKIPLFLSATVVGALVDSYTTMQFLQWVDPPLRLEVATEL